MNIVDMNNHKPRQGVNNVTSRHFRENVIEINLIGSIIDELFDCKLIRDLT